MLKQYLLSQSGLLPPFPSTCQSSPRYRRDGTITLLSSAKSKLEAFPWGFAYLSFTGTCHLTDIEYNPMNKGKKLGRDLDLVISEVSACTLLSSASASPLTFCSVSLTRRLPRADHPHESKTSKYRWWAQLSVTCLSSLHAVFLFVQLVLPSLHPRPL